MDIKEALEYIKENFIYLIEDYYDKPLNVKQTVITLNNRRFSIIEQAIDKLEKYGKFTDILKDILDVELWESKDKKYYLIEMGYYKELTQEEYDILKEYL